MNITVLDFETYYDRAYSLKKQTIPEYVHDVRFHVHGLAVGWPGGATEFSTDVKKTLSNLHLRFGPQLEGTTVVCHHAHFDLYVLNHRYGLRPRFFTDTMLLAYQVHGRREGGRGGSLGLKDLAQRYGLPSKGDLQFMCGVRYPDPREAVRLAEYAKRDVQLTAALAERLLPLVTRPEIELPILMHTVRLFTERGVRVDRNGISRLQEEIRANTNQSLAAAAIDADSATSNKRFPDMLADLLARTGRKVPVKPGRNGMIPATAKGDPEMRELLEDDDPAVAAIARARLEAKGEDQKLARLGVLDRVAAATNGILPPYLVYHGAQTGRFSGGGGFNVQNLGRNGLTGKVRGLLGPAPGQVLVIGDLAQIEARVTAWVAGQNDMLSAFRDGHDLYSEFASATFDKPVRKPLATDPVELSQELEACRQVGKQAVLGLGFNMGALKFMNRLRAERGLAALFDRGELTPLACRDIVSRYRRNYPCIVNLWKELERSAARAAAGEKISSRNFGFDREGDTVRLWLPSGRALRFPRLRLDERPRIIKYLDSQGQEAEFNPSGPRLVYAQNTDLYGGKLCENVVQAIARDLLAEAVLRLEDAGLRVVFHVHDEVIVEAPARSSETSRDEVERLLNIVPEWAAALPIASEVKVSHRYGK